LGRKVRGELGKGVFSTVLSCVDLHAPPPPALQDSTTAAAVAAAAAAAAKAVVAIKLIRNNDVMRKVRACVGSA